MTLLRTVVFLAGIVTALSPCLLPAAAETRSEEIQRPLSPETFLGRSKGRSYRMNITRSETVNYHYEGVLGPDKVGLKGLWSAKPDYIEAESDNSYLDMNFLATHAYLVLGGSSNSSLEISLDGKPYGKVQVDAEKKYEIVSTSYERHQLSIKVPKGIKAYVFTFGDDTD